MFTVGCLRKIPLNKIKIYLIIKKLFCQGSKALVDLIPVGSTGMVVEAAGCATSTLAVEQLARLGGVGW